MSLNRRDLLNLGAGLAAASAAPALAAPRKGGFQPSWESLAQGYKVPD